MWVRSAAAVFISSCSTARERTSAFVAPFFFPVIVQLLGLLTGVIQAYIFALLAMVYIASAGSTPEEDERANTTPSKGD